MTREETICFLRQLQQILINCNSWEDVKQAIRESLTMAIEALEAQRWIPVKERLPEKNQACLITNIYGDVAWNYWINGEWIVLPNFVVARTFQGGRRMIVAIWIIAICEVIRMLQNMIQIATIKHDSKGRDNAYTEFVKSLHGTDREFVREMLEEFERQENE